MGVAPRCVSNVPLDFSSVKKVGLAGIAESADNESVRRFVVWSERVRTNEKSQFDVNLEPNEIAIKVQ